MSSDYLQRAGVPSQMMAMFIVHLGQLLDKARMQLIYCLLTGTIVLLDCITGTASLAACCKTHAVL